MCGIAGFINFPDNNLLAEKANEIQFHRGPDNQSIYKDEYLALAHQRLSIIDLEERSNQPFRKYNLVLTFNGEIYNYKNLIEEHLGNVEMTTSSDTEVVLEMYRLFGEKCVEYFEGMFAFCIYNINNAELFCARDHFGIKPFFYYFKKGKFAFASELKTLIILPGFEKNINRKALISSINFLWIPGNETIFSDILKLPPGCSLYLQKDREPEIKRYWELKGELNNHSEDRWVKTLDSTFKNSIKKHMTADVPVSSFLSGGLDSSLISVAAKVYNKNISTYTIATNFKDKKVESMPEDEKYAKELADLHNFNHNEIIINSNIVEDLPKMVRTLDEPIGDPAALNTYLICNAARKKGVKVLLSGMGADEIFFGYRRQKALMLAQQYKRIPKVLRTGIRVFANSLPVKIGGKGLRLVRWGKKFISFAEMPIEQAYRMSYSYYSKEELKKVLKNPEDEIIESIYSDHRSVFNAKYEGDVVNQMCFTDINYFMVGLNLTYTDRSSMAASVEVRVPFIDKEVISSAMRIPGRLKFENNISKYLLKKMAESYLPENIIYRPKASFGAPIRSWISGDLKDMIDTNLCKEKIEKRGLFNYSYVKSLIDNDRNGLEDNAYRIYQLLTIELWFQEFIDK